MGEYVRGSVWVALRAVDQHHLEVEGRSQAVVGPACRLVLVELAG